MWKLIKAAVSPNFISTWTHISPAGVSLNVCVHFSFQYAVVLMIWYIFVGFPHACLQDLGDHPIFYTGFLSSI